MNAAVTMAGLAKPCRFGSYQKAPQCSACNHAAVRGELVRLVYRSILSKVGSSTNPGLFNAPVRGSLLVEDEAGMSLVGLSDFLRLNPQFAKIALKNCVKCANINS